MSFLRYYFYPGIKIHLYGPSKPLISTIPSSELGPSKPISNTVVSEGSQNQRNDQMIMIEKFFEDSLRSTKNADRLNSETLEYSYSESDSVTSEKDRTITETEEEISQFEHTPGSSQRILHTFDSELDESSPASFKQDDFQIRHHALSHPTEHAELRPVRINQQNIWKPNKIDETKKRMSDARLSFTAGILNESNANMSSDTEKEQLLKSSFHYLPINDHSPRTKAQFPTYTFPSPSYYDSSPQFVPEVLV